MTKPSFRRVDIFDIFIRMIVSMSMTSVTVVMKEDETNYIR
jgi:hypothetical protein